MMASDRQYFATAERGHSYLHPFAPCHWKDLEIIPRDRTTAADSSRLVMGASPHRPLILGLGGNTGGARNRADLPWGLELCPPLQEGGTGRFQPVRQPLPQAF